MVKGRQRVIALFVVVFVILGSVPLTRSDVTAQELDDVVAQVVGGRDAQKHEFPHLVAIFFDGFHQCGGALIASDWVVSAAHCFVDVPLDSVVLGLGSADIRDGLQLVAAANIVIHPQYDPGSFTVTNDVALVQLATPVDLTDPTVGLVALPVESQPDDDPGSFLVAGWGDVDPSATFESTTLARVAQVQAIPCGIFGDDDVRLCTADADGGGGCTGDSGGPLIQAAGRTPTLVAVVEATTSATNGIALCGRNTTVIHQRVEPHLDWMRAATGEMFRVCDGRAVTVEVEPGVPFFGTDADDVVFGTDSGDQIFGGGGDDAICAAGGDDWVDGGPGNDLVDGASGRDSIVGGAGNDVLIGGPDIDRLWGNDDRDTLYGDGGSDRLRGGDGNDTVHAGAGADRVWGGPGDDTLNGMGGQDVMWGEAGSDVLQGNHQSDQLYGGPGDDVIYAAGGKDALFGEAGDDELFGGANTDYLDGGSGNDIAHGGRGRDNPLVVDVSGCIAETTSSC